MKSNMRFLGMFLSIGLVLMAIAFWPFDIVIFEVPKVKFFLVWSVLLVAWIFVEIVTRKDLRPIGKLQKIVLAWLGATVLACLVGVDVNRSILGNFYRWDGLVTYFCLVGVFLGLSLFSEVDWWEYVVLGLSVGNVVSVLTVLGQTFGKTENIYGYGGGFGQPVFLAGYLLVTMPFLFSVIGKIGKKVLRVAICMIVICMEIVALYLTRSLGSIFFFPIVILGLFFDWRSKYVLGGIIIVVLAGSLALFAHRLEVGDGLIFEGRERIFRKALLAFEKRPLFGYGVANFDKAFDSVDWPIKIDKDIYVDKAHSNLVEMFVTSGLVGGGLYLGLLAYAFWKMRVVKVRRYILVAFLVYLLHSQTNVTSVAEELVFWLILARIA